MAHTLLSPTIITNKALQVLHQKLRFISSINRAYDDRFATSGAKIGTALQVRLPNEFVVRTGRTLDVQDVTETYETVNVTTQKGVDLSFDSADLTMKIDEFSTRYIEPAMSRLASEMEKDALTMYKDVPAEVSDVGATITLLHVLKARKELVDNLAPEDDQWVALLNTLDSINLVDALKGLYQSSTEISNQYKNGVMGIAAGFKFMETTHLGLHTTGTDAGTGAVTTNAANQSGASITTTSMAASTFKQGDVVMFEDVFDVHPETKVSTGIMKQFVVTADAAATTLTISPPLVATGAKQNASNVVATGKKVYKRESDRSTAIGASADYTTSLAFHKNAFTFVTADLIMPSGVDFAARQRADGISMRVVRQYDINNDSFPCRIDVFYGYKAIRPQLACRLGFN